MNGVLKETKKHFRIFFIFMKNCLIGQLEYRANFITGLLMELGYLFAKMLYIIVLFKAGASINGLSPDEVLVFVGTYVIITGFFAGLVMMNFYSMGEHIRNGTLDFYITKPVSLQFMLTLRHSDVSILLTDVIAGAIMVGIGLSRLVRPIDLLSMGGYVGYMFSGTIVGYALFFIPQLLSFKVVKTEALNGIMDSLWDFNNMPMGIYGKAIQRVGVFIIPIFLVTNLPAMFLLGRMDTTYAVWGILAPFIFMALTKLLWNKAVRHYSSASS